jgi:cation transport regulator ChaB
MQPAKTITITAAFILALSGYAFAQGTLGNGGREGSAVESAKSAVESAPSAVESAKGAVASSPTTGSGFGSSSDSSTDAPDGNPAGVNLGTGGGDSTMNSNGTSVPANPNNR